MDLLENWMVHEESMALSMVVSEGPCCMSPVTGSSSPGTTALLTPDIDRAV